MKAIIDPGHVFELTVLDGTSEQLLTFVKRESEDPLKFPGNKGHHPGTTLQSVIRALHSRVQYLDSQHHCEENFEIGRLLREINYNLEFRAARRHGREYKLTAHEAIDAPMCPACGHTECGGHEA